ncbi:nicotinate (nicotinamide) nucleotide adenylyltransferase [Acidicapsa dinghuensis]|uniref:Probable nicotinate-nucleotide adenylyltransferase n=1 Tax=Acidicapsa dinghuensis TaxID=2218256 RepID=A0ABW1EA86_9BACT|nr:nicotinate (nicotinamide) nucleotide adenylyltransferase [Acidicapsa dinghuensis]
MLRAPADLRRVAFFGGSFDPPHLGHLAIARAAREALSLDRVLFAPVGLQPLKPLGSSANFDDRVAMTRLAIAQEPGFEVSLLDAPKPGETGATRANYTIDTLRRLRKMLPAGSELFLLLGADSFRTLHHWHQAAEIPFVARLIVASRPASTEEVESGNENLFCCMPAGLTCEPMPGRPHQYRITDGAGRESSLTVLPDLHYEISATELRGQLQDGGQTGGGDAQGRMLIDPAVLAYIREHGLYQG